MMPTPYDSIINLPHPVSKKHPQMLIADRAAQFAPFAALTGYGAAIRETGRLTDKRIELDECVSPSPGRPGGRSLRGPDQGGRGCVHARLKVYQAFEAGVLLAPGAAKEGFTTCPS